MPLAIELLLLIIITLGTIISLSGLGHVLIFNYKSTFFESSFFGFLVLSFVITLAHFFFKISFIISFIIFSIGFFWGLKIFVIPKIHKLHNKKELFILFIIFLILVPIYISQKYHEDFGYYHLPYIINIVNEKIIFGLANANKAFTHNSIWLNILPVFYLNKNYDFVSIPTFLVYFIFVIFLIKNIISAKKRCISTFFLIISSFYLILKFTRISEYGNDLPALIYSILSIYYFLKFNEEENIRTKKKNLFFNLSFTLFSILIKFSSIPLSLLTLYLLIKNFKILISEIFKYNFILVYSLAFIFFLQQFIYTGCLIFPSNFSCLDVSWTNENFFNAKNRLELINKSYFASGANDAFSKEEYLKDLNWVPFWFKRNYHIMLEHLLTMILPLLIFLSFLKKSKSLKNKNLIISDINIFVIFTIIGFIFWLNFSPVYRFGIIYFLCIIFLSTLFIYKKKEFNKKIYIIFISIFLFFNFSKNILRIYNQDEIFVGISKVENEFIHNKKIGNSIIPIFQPDIEANAKKGNGWQGRLCWDINFLCSKNSIQVKKQKGYLIVEVTK